MSEIIFEEEKFRELLIYIAKKCEDDTFWGATKLNKQLFFADFLAYEQFGKPITGADYMAIDHGPVPRRLVPIRADMEVEGDIHREIKLHQDRIIADRAPELSKFSNEELALVDEVIDALRNVLADEISELSHKFAGWMAAIVEGQATKKNVTIPYETVFVRKAELTQEERQQTLAMASEYGWPV